jgi:HK97 family phage portal protein
MPPRCSATAQGQVACCALKEKSTIRHMNARSSGHGGENSGKVAILEDDSDFTPLTFNSVDLQFQEMRAFQLSEISRALGVPPVLLSEYGRATWANSEQMAQSFLTFTLLPRIKLWQGAISRLLSEEEQQTYYPEFLVDELVKADIAERFEAYSKAIASRIFNPNEIRAMENRPPYVGGEEFADPNITPNAPAPPAPSARPRPRMVAP